MDRLDRDANDEKAEYTGEVLQRTIISRAGERVRLSAEELDPAYLRQYNAALGWV